jgi:hypothetical protein
MIELSVQGCRIHSCLALFIGDRERCLAPSVDLFIDSDSRRPFRCEICREREEKKEHSLIRISFGRLHLPFHSISMTELRTTPSLSINPTKAMNTANAPLPSDLNDVNGLTTYVTSFALR